MEKLSNSLWILIVLFWYTSVCFGCTEEERNGLLKFQTFVFKQNNSENSDCCGWSHVKCDNATRRIVSLDLSLDLIDFAFYDEPVLDASLFLPFTHLQYLNLSTGLNIILQNHQDLGRLKKLEVLDLSYIQFNDSLIFHSLFTLSSLAVLKLSENGLNGSLSDVGRDLCKLRNLQKLNLDRNKITGSIPPCFENLTSLKVLDLSQNNLDAYLQELCKLRNIRELYLRRNGISGSIPPCFENLTTLRVLDLSGNNFNGYLQDLGRLNKLQVLILSGNYLRDSRIFQPR